MLVVGGAILRHGCVLGARRRHPPEAAGRWELPGGKVEEGETPEAALVRELAEELGVTAEVVGWLPGQAAIRPGLTLRVGLVRLVAAEPEPHEHDEVRWLTPESLDDVDWLDSDRPFLAPLRERLLDGEPLDGGNLGGVVRIGETVRRVTGPWTPAVHALLDHLAARGLQAVPRVHGLDERGREVLDLLRGEVIDVDTELLSEPRLLALAAWTRDLHAAVADFTHPGPWRHLLPGPTERIGHNDLAPYNVCFLGDEVSGVFDWDFAGPTTPALELAHQAWSAVPLFRDIGDEASARRLSALARGYGGIGAVEVLAVVVERVRASIDTVRRTVRAGEQGAEGLLAAGEPRRTERALADLEARLPGIVERL